MSVILTKFFQSLNHKDKCFNPDKYSTCNPEGINIKKLADKIDALSIKQYEKDYMKALLKCKYYAYDNLDTRYVLSSIYDELITHNDNVCNKILLNNETLKEILLVIVCVIGGFLLHILVTYEFIER